MGEAVHPGYLGLVDIDGVGQVRFTDSNITARQEIEAPDIIMGDYDHDAYVYGKIEVGGTISGPVTETFGRGDGLWDWATRRTGDCKELREDGCTIYYYCNKSRSFSGLKVNSVNFSCSAGEVAQFSVDLMGKRAAQWGSGNIVFTDAEKLITWDKVGVSIGTGGPGAGALTNVAYSNFDFTLSNNLEAVYSLSQKDLFPYQVVEGLRTITGTLSVFNAPEVDGVETWDEYEAADVSTLSFFVGDLNVTCKVQFHRVEPAASVGPVVSTVGFHGVTHQDF